MRSYFRTLEMFPLSFFLDISFIFINYVGKFSFFNQWVNGSFLMSQRVLTKHPDTFSTKTLPMCAGEKKKNPASISFSQTLQLSITER